jgi:hypothetical protein
MTEEEEEKLTRLEKRLVANVNFDDQALHILGLGMDIYYMLGHLGWVQFSNGVSANTHKEFSLEILMTVAPILNEGVLSLSSRLEGVQQVVPYGYIRELIGFQKGAPELVGVPEGMLDGFWNMIAGGAHQQRNTIRNPIIQVFHSWMCKRILGRIRETKVKHRVELALLGFDCQAANRPHSPYDQLVVLRSNIEFGRYWFGVLPLHVGYLFEVGYYKEPGASSTQDFPWV